MRFSYKRFFWTSFGWGLLVWSGRRSFLRFVALPGSAGLRSSPLTSWTGSDSGSPGSNQLATINEAGVTIGVGLVILVLFAKMLATAGIPATEAIVVLIAGLTAYSVAPGYFQSGYR
jgi:hypothetical protein